MTKILINFVTSITVSGMLLITETLPFSTYYINAPCLFLSFADNSLGEFAFSTSTYSVERSSRELRVDVLFYSKRRYCILVKLYLVFSTSLCCKIVITHNMIMLCNAVLKSQS